jgi:hypothetical protein
MKSAVIKRSIVIAGHKTSVSLEDAFWRGLKAIAHGRKINLFDLIASDVKNLYIGRFSGVAKRSSSPPRRTITRPGGHRHVNARRSRPTMFRCVMGLS